MNQVARLMLALLAPLPVMAAPVTYNIDSFHSFPNFSIGHLGMTTIHGRFDRMSGKVVLDTAAKNGSLEVKIQTASVSTGDDKRAAGGRSRDEHLRTPDFFNSAEFPEMTYKSTKFNFAGEKLESVEGNLTLLGVTKPVKLTVTSFNCGPHPFNKKPMCGAYVEGAIKRTDFGMKFGVPAISDEVKLAISVEAYPE
ncbi:MAG: polyisoprenoid-binding protein [Burkholderiales bacterium]|nr:polyisoprenoid-binding protein [Burkholderiales bacterium]